METYNETILETSPLNTKITFYTNIQGRCPLHWHEFLEILYPLNGESDILIDGVLHHQKRKQLLVVDSCKVHGTCHYGAGSMFLCIHISKKSLEWYFPGIEDYQINCIPDSVPEDKFEIYLEMCSLLKKVTELYITESPAFLLESEGLILQLVSMLILHFGDLKMPFSDDMDRLAVTRIRSIIDYVEKHFSETLNLQDMADWLGLSKEYFCRFFKKNMGMPFLQYLNEVRAVHVYQDLIHTDETIQVIMEKNGFTNQKLFNRTFKFLYGCTPSQIRKGEQSK